MTTSHSDPHTFDLSGGALCLEFANTIGDRPWGREEHLHGYGDLLEWARQAGILTAAETRRTGRLARGRSEEAQALFGRAVDLRETLYRVFSRVARGRPPGAGDLTGLAALVREAFDRYRLAPAGDRCDWVWRSDPAALDRPMWAVVRSAAELLTSAELTLVRECGGTYCSWLFLDRSRTRRRRWCSMKTCGNREKARRFYERSRQGG